MDLICLDGKFIPANEPVFLASHRGYRYGDGVFETIRVHNGRIPLAEYHFRRLFSSLQRLDYEIPPGLSANYFDKLILELCEKNGLAKQARVRLSVSAGLGELHTPPGFQFLIECFPYNPASNTGLAIDIFHGSRKCYDQFSDLKSANYLPYVLGARFAKINGFDDALILNNEDRVIESSVANLFIINKGEIYTPSLSEGCIAGVMRQWLLKKFQIVEKPVNAQELVAAEELFLTNALHGARWVSRFGERTYRHARCIEIQDFIKTNLWPNS